MFDCYVVVMTYVQLSTLCWISTEMSWGSVNRSGWDMWQFLTNGCGVVWAGLFALFRSPFTIDASVVPEAIQMELIELQCCAPLKDNYASVAIESFYPSLPPQYPMLTAFAGKILCMFGTTYLCEQAFSVMNINKSKVRNRLTHGHLNDVMKIATAQKLSPDMDKLVKVKRCLASTCSWSRLVSPFIIIQCDMGGRE